VHKPQLSEIGCPWVFSLQSKIAKRVVCSSILETRMAVMPSYSPLLWLLLALMTSYAPLLWLLLVLRPLACSLES